MLQFDSQPLDRNNSWSKSQRQLVDEIMQSDIDIGNLAKKRVTDADFVWNGMVARTVGGLIAVGGTGKSMLALQIATSVACGFDMLGLGVNTRKPGKVVYVSTEDSLDMIHDRLVDIKKAAVDAGHDSSAEITAAIRKNFKPKIVCGIGLDVCDEYMQESLFRTSAGARLIVLDTLTNVHSFNENSNGEMARLVGILTRIATRTGAAVLFLHHASKASIRDGAADHQHAARGASALIDNSRWCGHLSATKDNLVRLVTSKASYSTIPPDICFKRGSEGVLIPTSNKKSTAGTKANEEASRVKQRNARQKGEQRELA